MWALSRTNFGSNLNIWHCMWCSIKFALMGFLYEQKRGVMSLGGTSLPPPPLLREPPKLHFPLSWRPPITSEPVLRGPGVGGSEERPGSNSCPAIILSNSPCRVVWEIKKVRALMENTNCISSAIHMHSNLLVVLFNICIKPLVFMALYRLELSGVYNRRFDRGRGRG